jgi:hypothetical protein
VSTKPYQRTERRNFTELAPFDQERTVLVISFDTLIRIFSMVGISGIWFFNASVMVLRDVSMI